MEILISALLLGGVIAAGLALRKAAQDDEDFRKWLEGRDDWD